MKLESTEKPFSSTLISEYANPKVLTELKLNNKKIEPIKLREFV
jgi:hypothetical protein